MSGISEVLRPLVESHALAGAVTLVASKEKVLSLETVGYADIATGRAMEADTLFWIASMTKPMTAVAAMMLVDEGKISIEDPVEKYLPDYKGQMLVVEQADQPTVLKKPARPITIGDVLSHTSGMPFLSRLETKIDLLTLRESAMCYALTNLLAEPGTKYIYANSGINTAARVVEVVSGMPFETFMQERLLDPLGMHDTTFWPTEQQVQRLAKAYKPNPDKTDLVEMPINAFTYPLTSRRRTVEPGGGYFSTAADVSLFVRMILSGGSYAGRHYLSAKSLRRMTTTQTGDLFTQHGAGSGYGFGWETREIDPGDTDAALVGACGHGGALATRMWIDPAKSLGLVYLVQHEGYGGPEGTNPYPMFEKAAFEMFGGTRTS